MRPIIDDMFSISISVFILSIFVITTVDAQRPGFGKCPDYPAMKDFNITQFQGQWYEIERSFYLMEIPYSCVKFNFTLQQNSFKVTEFAYNRLTGRSTISYGFAKPNYLQPAILNYEVETALPKYLARIMPGSGKYLILHTDYDHYAILYSCSNLGILHADLLWVLGREKDLTVDSRVKVYDHLQTLNINTDRLTLTPRKKCPK